MKKFIIFILVIATLAMAGFIVSCNHAEEKQNEEKIEYTYNVTAEERELLARLVFFESSVCSDECQRMICSVVFNRIASGYWGDDIEETIFWPNSFSTAGQIRNDPRQPGEREYANVDYILQHGVTIPPEVRYFRTDHDFGWEGYQNYIVLDNVYFGYFTNGNH